MRIAAPKDRAYLETLNLKALQRNRKPAENQPAREFYEALQQEAKEGPLFGPDVLRTIEHLPELPKVVTKWLGNLKDFKDVDARGLNLIIDWVNGDRTAPQELSRLTWDQAVEAQQYWHEHEFKIEEHGEYRTHEVVFSTGGYDFVQIKDQDDLITEGRLMGHCVGRPEYAKAVKSGQSKIYSLRDSNNRPHVTIEVDGHGKSVRQCYGKQNKVPVQRYNDALVKFFEHMKLWDGVLHLKDAVVPNHVWHELATHSDESVRWRVANNQNTPVEILKVLAKASSEAVRWRVANNQNTPVEILKVLAKDSDEAVRWRVANNPNTPVEILKVLAKDSDEGVRYHVAKNPNTPAEVLKVLAKDSNEDVRRHVAYNTSTPSEVLKILAKDSDEDVRRHVAYNTNTPSEVLKVLAKDSNVPVRRSVAYNTNTPSDVLKVLAEDSNVYVRLSVAENPKTPADVLKVLAADNDRDVSQEAQAHPNFPG